MLFSLWLVLVLKLSNVSAAVEHRRVIRQAGSNACTTPDNLSGTCINIRSCPDLLQLLSTKGKEPAVAQFLRKSQCGTQGSSPKVCCPQNRSTTTTSTTRSTVTIRTTSTARPVVSVKPAPSNNADFLQCGKSDKIAKRIVGGRNATLGDWPWMVALGYRSPTKPDIDFKCGASLISNRYVVTAAHCVSNLGSLTLTTARIGDLDLNNNNNDGASPIDIPIEQIIPHPNYSRSPIANDIALIRLANSVTFTKLIRPICILSEAVHRSDAFYSKKVPFIIGWGATEWRGPSSSMLQEASIDIVDIEKCKENYEGQTAASIDERVLCAGRAGKDSCQGDSGGPLIIPIPNRNSFYLAGIVSFGVKCADSNYPGVYTRVAYFADWITRTANL